MVQDMLTELSEITSASKLKNATIKGKLAENEKALEAQLSATREGWNLDTYTKVFTNQLSFISHICLATQNLLRSSKFLHKLASHSALA